MSSRLLERQIQNKLHSILEDCFHHIIPNFTPKGWHECDMWAVSKAGYSFEFEIKVSKADFKKDAKKVENPRSFHWGRDQKNVKTKHQRISESDIKGPNRFYYVLPEDVVTDEEVPEWAGIYRWRKEEPSEGGEFKLAHRGGIAMWKEREAPMLSKESAPSDQIEQAGKAFYYRFWNERRRNESADLEA